MLKNKILVSGCLGTLFFTTNITPANALELDEDTRTVTLDLQFWSVPGLQISKELDFSNIYMRIFQTRRVTLFCHE